MKGPIVENLLCYIHQYTYTSSVCSVALRKIWSKFYLFEFFTIHRSSTLYFIHITFYSKYKDEIKSKVKVNC